MPWRLCLAPNNTESWLAAFPPSSFKLPQSVPLSPRPANLYLHLFDRILAAAGIDAVRYTDAFVRLARDRADAEAPMRLTVKVLRGRGHSLSSGNTAIVPARKGVRFLGERLRSPSVGRAPSPGSAAGLVCVMADADAFETFPFETARPSSP